MGTFEITCMNFQNAIFYVSAWHTGNQVKGLLNSLVGAQLRTIQCNDTAGMQVYVHNLSAYLVYANETESHQGKKQTHEPVI